MCVCDVIHYYPCDKGQVKEKLGGGIFLKNGNEIASRRLGRIGVAVGNTVHR